METKVSLTCLSCRNTIAIAPGKAINPSCSGCGPRSTFIQYGEHEILRIKCISCGTIRAISAGQVDDVKCQNRLCKNPYLLSFDKWTLPILDTGEIKEAKEKEITLEKAIVNPVSVVVLCHNKLDVTKECIDRIRLNSPAQIVLVDNGSTDKTLVWATEQKDISYIRNQWNLGCCIGRNQGASWAIHPYLLFLDNDQYIPMGFIERMLKSECDLTGVEHWRVFANGEVQQQLTPTIQIHDYVGSGGLFLSRRIFKNLMGYDERYAPAWYEDVDFCFRARLAGYTIGALENPDVKHLQNTTVAAQKTFDSDVAKRESRALFVKTWGEYIAGKKEWPFDAKGRAVVRIRRPKIAMLCDVQNWAWALKAEQIKKYLEDEFNIQLCFYERMPYDWKKFDAVFTFECDHVASGISHKNFITGVTAHTYQNYPGYKGTLEKADAVHANSKMLLSEIAIHNKNIFYLPNGVDLSKFPYKKCEDRKNLVVGYVGKKHPLKGWRVMEDACRTADVEFKPLYGKHNDSGVISHEKMFQYYHSIDVILIASTMDGTPNQLLEAASCGRTYIANKIGNVEEFHIEGSGYIVDEIDPEEYADWLEELDENRNLLNEMGRRARLMAETAWSWELKAENYRYMLRKVLYK